MATTVRMNSREQYRVGLLSAGRLGQDIVDLLAAEYPASTILAGEQVAQAFTVRLDVLVVATWRSYGWFTSMVDQLSFAHQLPWLPVTGERNDIWVGPLVDPPHGPCHSCWQRRRSQHGTHAAAAAAVESLYETDWTAGPAGHLPHHTRLVAGVVSHLLESLRTGGGASRAGDAIAGDVVRIGTLSGDVTASRVVACHDCPYCGGGGSVGTGVQRALLVGSDRRVAHR